MATLYIRNGMYYIQYYYKGRRIQRSLGTRDEDEALNELKQQEAKLVLDLEESRPDKITLSNYIKIYKKWSKPYKSEGTYKHDQYNLARYKTTFKTNLLRKITAIQLEDYIRERRGSCEISTVNREIGFLKAFFSKAVEWEYLDKSPAARLKLFKQSKRRVPRFFTEKEVELVLHKSKTISSYLHLIILTGVETGLRKSELIHLSWKDINLDNLSIIVQAKSNWHPKDYAIRSIPIGTELALELKKHKLKQEGISRWVFPTVYGTARKNNLGRGFKRLLKKCGLYDRGTGWHTLRHTFASHLVMKGTPLKTVSELLGHTSTRTTEIYSHLAPDHLREAIAKLSFGKKKKPKSPKPQKKTARKGKRS